MDSWCKPVLAKSGKKVSGGAARQVRIAAHEGGMDGIIQKVAKEVFQETDRLVRANNIKLVKSS